MFTFLGLTWHVYGLILAVAVMVGWWLVTRVAHRHQLSIDFLADQLLWIILGGVIGARLYHVLTDWPLYATAPWQALYIWRGGLGIVGAVLGGGSVLSINLIRHKKVAHLAGYLDVITFGLPISQAIGRLGNYVNQELYGRPTQLPWGIEIDVAHRLPGYETVAIYQPLFAYEMIGLLVFGAGLWVWDRFQPLKLGKGIIFASYLAYYAVLRFGLDFLRLDARRVGSGFFTLNQLVMVVIWLISLGYILRNNYGHAHQSN